MKIFLDGRAAKRLAVGVAIASATAVLASCGGHDDNGNGSSPPAGTTPSNTPPASASADVPGFIAYLKVLVATQQDTADPLDVSGFTAPTTATGDPDPSI